MNLKTAAFRLIAATTVIVGSNADVRASFNLVTNGNFSSTTGGTTGQTSGQLNYTSGTGAAFNLTGWTTSGYNFLMNSGTPTAIGQYNSVSLWAASSSGLTNANNTWDGSAPGGGNFIAADGDFNTVAITQSMQNLSVGQLYAVSFYWAGAQQTGYTTASTDQWEVSLGSQNQYTSVYSNPGEGFSGWSYVTMDFTATATTETLAFLAIGTPSGVPPFALLEGVSMNAVPEPSSLVLLGLGLFGVGIVRRRRRRAGAVLA